MGFRPFTICNSYMSHLSPSLPYFSSSAMVGGYVCFSYIFYESVLVTLSLYVFFPNFVIAIAISYFISFLLEFKHHFLASAIPNHSLWRRFFFLYSENTISLSSVYITHKLILNNLFISCHRLQVLNE